MPTITTDVDVDLDDFDADELLDALKAKIKSKYTKDEHKKEIKEGCAEILKLGGGTVEKTSLADQLKLEAFMQGKDSKSIDEINRFFNY